MPGTFAPISAFRKYTRHEDKYRFFLLDRSHRVISPRTLDQQSSHVNMPSKLSELRRKLNATLLLERAKCDSEISLTLVDCDRRSRISLSETCRW